jgi:transposase
VRGRSYAAQDKTLVVRVSNKRHGMSIISTVTNRDSMRWKIFEGALNANILIDFMKRLARDAGRKVYLILDNLRVHRSKPLKVGLAEHKSQIEVFYLPRYGPEPNPDEMVNADLKQAVNKVAPARTKLQLVKAASKRIRSVQRRPEQIKSYFEHGPVCYAA